MAAEASEIRIYGVRHHGPGSARSLKRALEAFAPDALLLEAPADVEASLPLAMAEGTVPPVALLAYVVDDPRRSLFFPFAEFSPEWVAIEHATTRGIPLRAIDLPAAHTLSWEEADDEGNDTAWVDPLQAIAEAAGAPDGERWWEHTVEQRRGDDEVFDAVALLMTELRAEIGDRPGKREAAREAHMRLAIRRASADGFQRLAVVCGAWHVPALGHKSSASADAAHLKGLPKAKIAATWVPWTYDRLAVSSGYGAGVISPAYYEHLWRSEPEKVVSGWLLRAARLMRAEDLDASPASVIEAVRLAETLAALRERPVVGMEEMLEAARTVLCQGDATPMQLIHDRLIVGDALGQVPETTPTVPLQADLAALQKRLRLKPELALKSVDLDLRGETDLARSQLLHRLTLLGIGWGTLQEARGKRGTFHEIWQLQWRPELIPDIIDASRWGATVELASAARATSLAGEAQSLPSLTELTRAVLLAALPSAVGAVLRRLDEVAAVATAAAEPLDSLPPLGAVLRYGDVRQTDAEMVARVFDSIFVRACVGLPPACASMDDDAARAMAGRLDTTQTVVSTLDDAERESLWFESLRQVADIEGAHGLVLGRACRLLMDGGRLDRQAVAQRLAQIASPGSAPKHAAAWIEGFLGRSGALLLHDERLFDILDAWITGLAPSAFDEVLPLLRRTFAAFTRPERRQIGERVAGATAESRDLDLDEARALRPLPLLRRMLGMEVEA